VKLKEVNIHKSAVPNAVQGKSLKELAIDYRVRQIERNRQQALEDQQRKAAEINCNDARRRLDILNNGKRILIKGQGTSDSRFMADDAREVEINRQRQCLQGCQ
jgi:regulator of protease activity HflC (stomatin/prohibitin superfamily)